MCVCNQLCVSHRLALFIQNKCIIEDADDCLNSKM